jgi:hypothetical protein
MVRRKSTGSNVGGSSGRSTRSPRNYHELGKLGGEARKRQLMGGGRGGEED